MFTMKHQMGVGTFALEIASYHVDRADRRVIFKAYSTPYAEDRGDGENSLGIWGGFQQAEDVPDCGPENVVMAVIWVMNGQGQTVDKISYFIDRNTLAPGVETQLPPELIRSEGDALEGAQLAADRTAEAHG